MFKLIWKACFVVLLLLIAVLWMRNTLAIWLVEGMLQKRTGFPATIGKINIELTRPHFTASNLVLENPKEAYREPRAINIRLLEADYDLFSLFSDEWHFYRLVLDIPEIVAVRSLDGGLNLKRLQRSPTRQYSASTSRAVRIDEMDLSLGEVLYYDEEHNRPQPTVYKIHVKNRIYKDILRSEDVQKLALNLVVQSLPENILGLAIQELDQQPTSAPLKPVEDSAQNLLKLLQKTNSPH